MTISCSALDSEAEINFPESPEKELIANGITLPIKDNAATVFHENPVGIYRLTKKDLDSSIGCIASKGWDITVNANITNSNRPDSEQIPFLLQYSVLAKPKPTHNIDSVRATLLLNPQLEYFIFPALTWIKAEFPNAKTGFGLELSMGIEDASFPVHLSNQDLFKSMDVFFRDIFLIIEYNNKRDVIAIDKNRIVFVNSATQ